MATETLEFEFTATEIKVVNDTLDGILEGEDTLISVLRNICGKAGTKTADACFKALRFKICGELKDINKTLKLIRAKKIKDASLIVRVRKYSVLNTIWGRDKKPKAKVTAVASAVVFEPINREDINSTITVINANPEVYENHEELIAAFQIVLNLLPEEKKAAKKKAAKK